jgi:hypothetical protein
MRFYRCVLAFIILAITSSITLALDFSKVTCHAFLASGQGNMAAMIMFLRGYHAGKTGVIPYPSPDPYGGRLGFYCRQHPDTNLIDASEQILSDLDRGL